VILLHPPVAPWLVAHTDGCDVVLLSGDLALDAVFLRSLADNEEQLLSMRADGHDGALQRWRAFLPWDRGNDLTRYAFKALAGDRQRWLAADGMHPQVPGDAVHFRIHPSHKPPEWVSSQVFYQIFPDRFARAAAPRDRRGEVLHSAQVRPVVQCEWGAPVPREHGPNAFYGGDLDGIRLQLDYLQHELGVTALYLNPIFTAGSNHRYDTEDYTRVCPELGGNAAFEALCAETHRRGMRIVIDGVFNHTGVNHPWFNRWGRHETVGAAQDAQSPWRAFYVFDDQGQVIGWKGHASLPVLDFAEPAVQAAIYGADDAIVRRWLRPPYAIDGWRLDVMHMLGEGPGARHNARHAQAIRRAMREENPQAYMLGEHFAEATRWLQGDQEDGAMNYHGFGLPLRAWLTGRDVADHPATLSTAEFERWLGIARATIPYENQLAQYNLLDSHDTPRFLTLLGGDVARMKLAVTMLFCWPGAPSIYYGDEIGLEGGGDPDCRRCFDWDRSHWNAELFAHYRALAALRGQRAEWRHGAIQTLYADGDVFAFARYGAQAATIVAINRGPATSVSLRTDALPRAPTLWHEPEGSALASIDGRLAVALPACGARVLLA